MSNEIETAVTAILENVGVSYSAAYRGVKENALNGSHSMDQWDCEFTTSRAPKKSTKFDFYTGLGHRTPAPKPLDGGPVPRKNTIMFERLEKQRSPVAPHAACVLNSLILDSTAANQTFNDWCADCGYDNDSIKALGIYRACQESAEKLRVIFDSATIKKLTDAIQDY